MSLGFRRMWRGGVAVDLDYDEAAVLRAMARLVLSLVEPPEPKDGLDELVGIGGHSEAPQDPVLARLFPDAYAEDAEAAGDFRRYTEDSLREGKRAGAEAVLDAVPEAGGRVELDREQALVWLKSLNDVRLVLGTRLGIEEDGRVNAATDDGSALHVYDFLTALQDSLVNAMR